MGIVNRYPRGFLSLLDSQTQGQAPAQAGESISPTLEMLPFLGAAKGYRIEQDNGGVHNVAGPGHANIQVPVDEFWLLYAVSVDCFAQDAGSGAVRPTIQLFNPSDPTRPLTLSNSGSALLTVAGQWFSQTFQSPTPLPLNSGAIIWGGIASCPSPPTGLGWGVVLSAYVLRLSA